MTGTIKAFYLAFITLLIQGCYDNSHFVHDLLAYESIDSSMVDFKGHHNGSFCTIDHHVYVIGLTSFKYYGEEWPYGLLQDSTVINQSKWIFKRRGIGFGARMEKMRKTLGEKGGIIYYRQISESLYDRIDGLPDSNGVAIIYCGDTNIIYLLEWRIYDTI